MNILTLKALATELSWYRDHIECKIVKELDKIERIPFNDDEESVKEIISLYEEYDKVDTIYDDVSNKIKLITDSEPYNIKSDNPYQE